MRYGEDRNNYSNVLIREGARYNFRILGVPAAIRAGFAVPLAFSGDIATTAMLYDVSIWLLARMGADA